MSQDYTVHRDMHMLMNDNVLRIQTVQDYAIANETIMWVFYSYPPILANTALECAFIGT